jgi:hypothetical protein
MIAIACAGTLLGGVLIGRRVRSVVSMSRCCSMLAFSGISVVQSVPFGRLLG